MMAPRRVRPWSLRCVVAGLALASFISCRPNEGAFDLVIAGGRVMDPASSLDAVRYIGIRGGAVSAISERPLSGTRTIDAHGLVVAPGFIDLHAHGNGFDGDRWQVQDGVTTSFELEEARFQSPSGTARWKAAHSSTSVPRPATFRRASPSFKALRRWPRPSPFERRPVIRLRRGLITRLTRTNARESCR
jgi:hypothetical protein